MGASGVVLGGRSPAPTGPEARRSLLSQCIPGSIFSCVENKVFQPFPNPPAPG